MDEIMDTVIKTTLLTGIIVAMSAVCAIITYLLIRTFGIGKCQGELKTMEEKERDGQ